MKVAYNILHKLGTKQEPMVRPGDRVSEVQITRKPLCYDSRTQPVLPPW